MQIIKKYANRKLYHTNRKQYITLEGIAELVEAGEDIQVVDNETGEDITASILSQIVLLSRGRRNAVPPQILSNWIQSGSDTIAGFGRSMWATLSGSAAVDAEIKRRVQGLCEEGVFSPEEAARIEAQLLRLSPAVDTRALSQMASPSDVARLTAQVDALSTAVEQFLAERRTGNVQLPSIPEL